jgi:hypothetical protein
MVTNLPKLRKFEAVRNQSISFTIGGKYSG